MRFAFDENQELIRRSIDDLTTQFATAADCRSFADSNEPYSARLWAALAEAGFIGVRVPERNGGAELGLLEAGSVLEALGRSLASVPYLSTSVLAAEIIKDLGSDPQRDEWLPAIAEGGLTACVLGVTGAAASISETGGIDGRWAPVVGAAGASLTLVRISDSEGEGFVAVTNTSPHLVVEPLSTMDATRRTAAIQMVGLPISAASRLPKRLSGDFLARLEAIAAAGAAAEMLGVATRVRDMALAYAKERQQFGQPIGAFQAIKHMIADQQLLLEGLRSAVWAALWTLDNRPTEGIVLAAIAKSIADEAVVRLAAENIQIHGGMGFTAEVDAHLYLKRAQLDRILWSPEDHCNSILSDRLEELV